MKAIPGLRTMPARCPPAEEDAEFEEEIRVLVFGKGRGIYRILFTVRDDEVHILYVRRGARGPVSPG